jgi:hypothetical protein
LSEGSPALLDVCDPLPGLRGQAPGLQTAEVPVPGSPHVQLETDYCWEQTPQLMEGKALPILWHGICYPPGCLAPTGATWPRLKLPS